MKCAACGYTDTVEPVKVPINLPKGAQPPVIIPQVKEEFKMVLLELPLRDGTEGVEMAATSLFACPQCGTVRYEENFSENT